MPPLFQLGLLLLSDALGALVGVIDAGSTGTRLKLYRFRGDKFISGENLEAHDLDETLPKKGLHEESREEIERTLAVLLKRADESENNMALGFYGTAGLRTAKHSIKEMVLSVVRGMMGSRNVYATKVLTGHEEALYTLRSYEHYFPDDKDFTIIDMGGRSVQIIHKKDSEVFLDSFEMGMLNSDCSKQSRGPLTGSTLVGSLEETTVWVPGEWAIKSATCSEVDHGARKSYECEETYVFNSFLSRDERTDEVGTERLLPILSLRTSLAQKAANPVRIECIDRFLENNKRRMKQAPSEKVILLSFYEKILPDVRTTTLNKLYENIKESCATNKGENCRKIYYSVKFLEWLGILPDKELILMKSSPEFDVTWSMGVAIEINAVQNGGTKPRRAER